MALIMIEILIADVMRPLNIMSAKSGFLASFLRADHDLLIVPGFGIGLAMDHRLPGILQMPVLSFRLQGWRLCGGWLRLLPCIAPLVPYRSKPKQQTDQNQHRY